MKLAWHFVSGNTLRDGKPWEIGRPEVYTGKIVMCCSGLHYSYRPLDALRYAPGLILRRVEVDNIADELPNKGVCSWRRPIGSHDVTDLVLLWSADVAEHAARKYYTGDSGAPRVAIEMVRAYVAGDATRKDCDRAARAAYAAAAAANADADAAASYAAHAAAHAAAADAAAAANAAAYAAHAAHDAHNAADAAHAAAYAAANRLLSIRIKKLFGELEG